MRKRMSLALIVIYSALSLCGCSTIGSKSASVSVIYVCTAVLSLILLAVHCRLIKRTTRWFPVLFLSITVVNTGYLLLSISDSLAMALNANRLAYLGSVFLPFSMLFIMLHACRIRSPKWLIYALTVVSICIFAVAASPGFSDVYYKEVSLATVNGVTVLEKVYGPLHPLYLLYLTGYFGATVGVFIWVHSRNRLAHPLHGVILACACFINNAVWLLEQLVKIDFELLSVSYIISELFLLVFNLMIQEGLPASETEHSSAAQLPSAGTDANMTSDSSIKESVMAVQQAGAAEYAEKCEYLASHLRTLTPTEHSIYELYVSGMGTREVLSELGIKENTLKYHNRNIYSKLGVSSRRQLIEIAAMLEKAAPPRSDT